MWTPLLQEKKLLILLHLIITSRTKKRDRDNEVFLCKSHAWISCSYTQNEHLTWNLIIFPHSTTSWNLSHFSLYVYVCCFLFFCWGRREGRGKEGRWLVEQLIIPFEFLNENETLEIDLCSSINRSTSSNRS